MFAFGRGRSRMIVMVLVCVVIWWNFGVWTVFVCFGVVSL